jgi:hypothetical protein
MLVTWGAAFWTVLLTGLVWAACQQGPIVLVADRFGVSRSWSSPRMSAVLRSPSALASASRSCWFSLCRVRMRAVAASRRRSKDASDARCLSGIVAGDRVGPWRSRSRSISARRSSWV